MFFRDFILGNNETGLVTNSSGSAQVVGGEASSLQNGILPGTSGIIYGSGSDLSTAFYPSATVAAWDAFIATAAPGATQNSGTVSRISKTDTMHIALWTITAFCVCLFM